MMATRFRRTHHLQRLPKLYLSGQHGKHRKPLETWTQQTCSSHRQSDSDPLQSLLRHHRHGPLRQRKPSPHLHLPYKRTYASDKTDHLQRTVSHQQRHPTAAPTQSRRTDLRHRCHRATPTHYAIHREDAAQSIPQRSVYPTQSSRKGSRPLLRPHSYPPISRLRG